MNELTFEKSFWGDCCNTFGEDQKHFIYGNHMGLQGQYFSFDARHCRVLDIGGGPTSMLLKTWNLREGLVCDPIEYPQWTRDRYAMRNIRVQVMRGEDVDQTGWDEVWIYNVLQHCDDPKKIIRNARRAAPILRIFEWIDIPPHEGHPHMLTQSNLEKWIGQTGSVVELTGQNGCYGRAFHGYFHW